MDRFLAATDAVNRAAEARPAMATVPKRTDRFRKKLEAAIDAYLADSISKEELETIKLQCRINPVKIDTGSHSELLKKAESVLSGKQFSEIFLKTLLESVTVYKNGNVEIRLKDFSAIWYFELFLSNE
jgi:hypothetical protein